MSKAPQATKPEKEQNLAKALSGLADGTYTSFHQASRETGTPRRTLVRRFNGGKTRVEGQVSGQSLSPEQESSLVKWVEYLSCTGLPVHHQFLRDLANELLKSRLTIEGSMAKQVGKHWVSRFLARHPSLQSKVAKSIEMTRAKVTQKQLQNWFTVFKQVVDEYNIDPENIYNMDETGDQ